MPQIRPKNQGFTILELSIVLVILGLLMGGILAGQNLIENARNSKVITDVQKFNTAANGFHSKYGAWPGDFGKAEAIWGTDTSGGGCPDGDDVAKKETCNGNADNVIAEFEPSRFWQHLANAGFIEGQYSGYFGAVYSGPATSIPDKYFNVEDCNHALCIPAANNLWFSGAKGRAYYVSDLTGGANGIPAPIVYSIDSKIDDGKPGTGKVQGGYRPDNISGSPICMTTNVAATAEYLMSQEECRIWFVNQF